MFDLKEFKGKKVTIRAGSGFHDFTHGIDSFERTNIDLFGKIRTLVDFSQVWIDLEDGRYVKTIWGVLNVEE